MWGRRHFFALALAGSVAGLILPPPAHAIPIIDLKTAQAHLRTLITQIGDYYFVMREWRDKMLEKAEWANEKALAVLEQRRDIERRAYGELAGIGKGLPNWEKFANECRYDVNGVSICDITNVADRHIQGVVSFVSDSIQDTFFSGANAIEKEVESLIGRGTSQVISTLNSAGPHPLNNLERYHKSQAESGKNLERLSEQLDSLASQVQTQEQLDSMVSSGRADQLVAHISVEEAAADLELTRQRIQQLRVQTIDVLDRMLLLNRHHHRNAASPLGF